jgi:hypothetical protein
LTALHRGQTLRDGALSVQLDALRLRLFALEVFFLGTAIVDLFARLVRELVVAAGRDRPAGSGSL